MDSYSGAKSSCESGKYTASEIARRHSVLVFDENRLTYFSSFCRVEEMRHAVAIIDELRSNPKQSELYGDLFAALCGLHGEIFKTKELITICGDIDGGTIKEIVEAKDESGQAKTFIERANDIKFTEAMEGSYGYETKIPEAALLFLYFCFHVRRPGVACNAPDIGVEAQRSGKNILLIRGANPALFRYYTSTGLTLTDYDHKLPDDTVVLHYTRGHYQACIRR